MSQLGSSSILGSMVNYLARAVIRSITSTEDLDVIDFKEKSSALLVHQLVLNNPDSTHPKFGRASVQFDSLLGIN